MHEETERARDAEKALQDAQLVEAQKAREEAQRFEKQQKRNLEEPVKQQKLKLKNSRFKTG